MYTTPALEIINLEFLTIITLQDTTSSQTKYLRYLYPSYIEKEHYSYTYGIIIHGRL